MLGQVTLNGATGYHERLVVDRYVQLLAGYLVTAADRAPQYRQFELSRVIIPAEMTALILNGRLCFIVYARRRT